jgi:hypothetical protein
MADEQNPFRHLNVPAAAPQPAPTARGVVIRNPEVREEERAEESQAMEAERLGLSQVSEARSEREEVRGSSRELRTEYRSLPAVESYEQALPNFVSAIQTEPTTTGDLALVYYFAKTIDPGSAVQQGEMENIQNTDARLPAAAQSALRELRLADGKFTDRAREGLRRELWNTIVQRNQAYRSAREQYRELARAPEYGIDPDLVVGEHLGTRYIDVIDNYLNPEGRETGAGGGGGGEGPAIGIVSEQESIDYWGDGEPRFNESGQPVAGDYFGIVFDRQGNPAGTRVRVTAEPDARSEMGILEGMKETITGEARSTPEIEALPDWATMPEMNQLSVASFQSALGTMMSNPQETATILQSQFPGMQIRQDQAGNFILRSTVDGQEYAIKPGFRVSDIPRAVGSVAAFTPAGRATTVAGGFAGSAATQAGIEATQAMAGGEINPEEILMAGAGGAIAPVVSRGVQAVRTLRQARAGAPAAPSAVPGAVEDVNWNLMRGASAAPEGAPMAPPGTPPTGGQIIAEPPVGAPLPSAGGAIEITAQDIARFTTPEDRAMFNQSQLEYLTRSRKFADQQAAQPNPPAAPTAAAAPSPPAGAVPPAPTPPRAPSVAEQQGISQDLIRLARASTGRGASARAAREELAAMVEADPTLIQQAEALGLELPADVFSASIQLRNLTGLARSQPGSEAQAAWQQTLADSAQQVENGLSALGASRDLAGLSEQVFTRLNSNMDSLAQQGDALRQGVNANLNLQSRVDATNLQRVLGETINELGGIDEARKVMTAQERMLLEALGVGTEARQPTYAYLDRLRREIGRGLERRSGPWADTDEQTLSRLYGALAQDRVAHVQRELGQEAADQLAASNDIFTSMYAARKEMTDLFGRDLDRGIGTVIRGAIAQGGRGDATGVRRLLAAVPDDMRNEVAFSGILANARSRGAEGGFSFANFRNTYRAIRENTPVYRELARNMAPEQRQFLDNLYAVSRRISDAESRVERTGRALSPVAREINAQSLTQRIVEQATRRGVGAAVGGVGGTAMGDIALGVPMAVGLETALAALSRGTASNLDRVNSLIGSTAYREVVDAAASGADPTRAVNRLANSRSFINFTRGMGLDTQEARRAWIQASLASGSAAATAGQSDQTDIQPATARQ